MATATKKKPAKKTKRKPEPPTNGKAPATSAGVILHLDAEERMTALKEIAEANAEVDQHSRKVLDAKLTLDGAKEILKGAVADRQTAYLELQHVIGKWTAPTEPNLFNTAAQPSANGTPVDAAQDDSWRATPLTELVRFGATAKMVENLAAHKPPLEVFGDVTDWLKDPKNQLADVKVFGAAAVTRLDDAFEAFWKQRKADAAKVVSETAASTEVEGHDADQATD